MTRSSISRRELLKLSAGTLLALGLWPGRRAFAAAPIESFPVAVINDLHCMSKECCDWLEKVAADVKSRSPRFCVLAGDLTDTADPKYMDAVHSIFSGLGCPLHVQIGNHDYLTDSDRSSFEKRFPNSLNYVFEEGGWQCIALDTTQGTKWQKTRISADTLQWLDATLPALSKSKPTAVFTHFPLGSKTALRPGNADDLLTRLLDFNLQTVFSGHYHGYTLDQRGKTDLVTDKCCALKRENHDGTKEKGYFLCRFENGAISRKFIQMNLPA